MTDSGRDRCGGVNAADEPPPGWCAACRRVYADAPDQRELHGFCRACGIEVLALCDEIQNEILHEAWVEWMIEDMIFPVTQ